MSTLSLRKIKHDSSAVDNITLNSNGTTTANAEVIVPSLKGASGNKLQLRSGDSSFGVSLQNISGVDLLAIDAVGRMTLPYQPAFYAMMNNTNITGTAAIVFEDVYVNRGSCYNSANGRFTAPVAGTYMFSANFLKRSGSGRLLFHKNDTYYGSGNSQVYAAATVDTPLAATIIITLAVNDYVNVIVSIDAGDVYGNPNSHNGFSGFLIG